jgi:hypothetical protein
MGNNKFLLFPIYMAVLMHLYNRINDYNDNDWWFTDLFWKKISP